MEGISRWTARRIHRLRPALHNYARTHKEHLSRHSASKAIHQILATRHIDNLPRSEVRAIGRYAKARFGSERYAPWLIAYTLHRGTFVDGWIPEEYFRYRILPKLNRAEITTVSNVKTLAGQLLGAGYTPDLAVHVSGTWVDSAGTLRTRRAIRDRVFKETPRVYAKSDFKERGTGVHILGADEFDDFFDARPHEDFVIQKPLSQHPTLRQTSPDALATLRVITVKRQGMTPSVRAAYLRMGRRGTPFTSADQEQIKVAVATDAGALNAWGANQSWHPYTNHPDTGVRFADVTIPKYQEAVAICEKLHLRVPQFGYIGWDVAITEDSDIQILEWNTVFPAFAFIEASRGPLLCDLLSEGA